MQTKLIAEVLNYLLPYGLDICDSRGIPPHFPALIGPVWPLFLSHHPFAKNLSGGQITRFRIQQPPMASYAPYSVLPASNMLWDSVVQHYATCAHTPCTLLTPNTPYSSTLLWHCCALRAPTPRTYPTARSLYRITILGLQTHELSPGGARPRDSPLQSRWRAPRRWSLRAMKITWVIMECIVMIHSTVWLTYEALGSVVLAASSPHRPRGGALGTHGCHAAPRNLWKR